MQLHTIPIVLCKALRSRASKTWRHHGSSWFVTMLRHFDSKHSTKKRRGKKNQPWTANKTANKVSGLELLESGIKRRENKTLLVS